MGVQYEVNLGNVRSVIGQQQSLSVQIGMVNMSVLQAQTMLRLTMSAAVRSNIDAKLKKIRQDLEDESQSARQMNRTLQEVVDIYNSTEQQAMDAQKDLSADGQSGSGLPQWLTDFANQIAGFLDKDNNSVLEAFKFTASLLKNAGKAAGSDEASLTGKLFALFSSVSEIANSTPQELFGNVTGYVSDSFSILNKLSEILEDSSQSIGEKLGLSKFGAVTSVISSVTGLVEDIAGVVEKWNSTTGDVVDRFASTIEQIIECGGSVVDTIISGNGMKAVLEAVKKGSVEAAGTAKKALKSAKSWLTLVDTVVSSVSSGAKATIELGADGRISGQDVGEILFTSGINGLDALISGVTFGLVSCETVFGKNADECVDAVKSWATDISTNASNYIVNNSQRRQEFLAAGPLKQTAMIFGAVFAGNTEENRTVVPGHNVEATEGTWMKIGKALTKTYPGMMSIALPVQ